MTQQTVENMVTREPVKLPAALSSVMSVSRGFQAPDPDRLRIVITGRPGCGKTSFVASNPRCLLIDLEKNSGTVIDPACQRAQIRASSTTAADDIRQAVRGFLTAYRTDTALQQAIGCVAFDSFDALVDIFSRDLSARNGGIDIGDIGGGHGKGYFKVRDELFGLLEDIHRAGLGWVLVAHQSLKEVNGVTVQALNVSKSFRDQLIRSRDLMFKMEVTSKIQQRTKSGAVITVESKNPADRRHVLITDTSTTAEDFDSPKSNVPIESGLTIPPKDGWATFREAYNKALAKRQAEGV